MTGAGRWLSHWRYPPRAGRSVRARLTLLYGALFLLTGAALLAITYLLVDQTTATALFVNSKHGQVAIKSAPAGPVQGDGPTLRNGPATPQQLQLARHLLAQGRAQHAHDLHQLLTQSGIALAIMAVVAVGLGWLMAGRVLRPLRTITSAAQRISEHNLNERLALAGPDDEIKALADTIDDLLRRLENAFDAQKHFVANAAHELRTPLALDRALLEVALADSQASVGDLRGVLRDLLASSHDQQQLMDGLLTLASSERGLDRYEPIDLAALADRVVALRHGFARDRNIEMHASLQPAATMGNPQLAERLITNLVDNALNHNHPGGYVHVRTETRADEAILHVVNTGPTLADDAISALFQPFERIETSRSVHPDGHGLGLSIVRAVAAAHHAGLKVMRREEGGLDIAVHFPSTATIDGNDPCSSEPHRQDRQRQSPVTRPKTAPT